MIGQTISHYRIINYIGGGGMGVVYRAEDTRLKRPVALKFLSPELTRDPEAKTRFFKEARAASQLDHPNICTVYEIDETEDGRLFIATAYYPGFIMKTKIAENSLTLDESLFICIEIAKGLKEAHQNKIIHRDIKPANIMLTAKGDVKILDFGLAKFTGSSDVTRKGALAGTVAYMSPEQTKGSGTDARTDIWSLGVILYEMLTGQLPFSGDYDQAIIYSILNEEPEPLYDYPVRLEKLVKKALQKKSEDRYQNMDEFLVALNTFAVTTRKGMERELGRQIVSAVRDTESERKLITILELRITTDDQLTSEETLSLLNEQFEIAGKSIESHGGFVNKISDNTLRALFGFPEALEDAPREALNAAIHIRNLFSENNKQKAFRFNLAVNTGRVITGEIGSGGKKEYTVMGPSAELNPVLLQSGEDGEIRVGSTTYKYTVRDFAFTALEPLPFEHRKTSCYLLNTTEEKIYRTVPGTERMIWSEMVGRDSELNQLMIRVLKVIEGEGFIVNVIGEAGIGKSRLMAELQQKAEISKVNLLEGTALSIGQNLSYHPLIDILKHWADIKEADEGNVPLQKLEKLVKSIYPEEADEIIPFISIMMGMKLSGKYAERVKGIEGEALEKLIMKNFRDFLAKASEAKPLILILEDLHWADLSSIALLESLFRLVEKYPVLFINVFRPDFKETGERIRLTQKERYPTYSIDIVLNALDREQMGTLITNLLQQESGLTDIREQIAAKADGNPFFIEEVIRSLIDQGAIRVSKGRFEIIRSTEEIFIPERINDVLMARIDRLDEKTRSLLKVASVIGRSFFYKILAEVAKETEKIDDRLEYLKDIQLIKERQRMAELEYLFKHALARDATYDSILHSKRKELHRIVADAIERVFADRLTEFYGVLALHYSKAEEMEKAEEYLTKAGEEALRTAASKEALFYYQEGLKIYLEKSGKNIDQNKVAYFEKKLAIAFYSIGRVYDAEYHFDKYFRLHGINYPSNPIKIKLLIILNIFIVLFIVTVPFKFKKKEADKNIEDFFHTFYTWGKALAGVNTIKMVLLGMKLIRRLNKYNLTNMHRGASLFTTGTVIFSLSGISFFLSNKSLTYSKQFLTKANITEQYEFYFDELLYKTLAGKWYEEDISYIEWSDICLKLGDYFIAICFLFWYGLILAEQGKFQKADSLLKRLFQIHTDFDNDLAIYRFEMLRYYVALKKNEFNDIINNTDKLAGKLESIGQFKYINKCIGINIIALIRKKNFRKAEVLIKKNQTIMKNLENKGPIFMTDHYIGLFMLNLEYLNQNIQNKERKRILENLKTIKNTMIKYSLKNYLALTETYRLIGQYYLILKKNKKAFHYFKLSIQLGEKLSARPELARTYFEVGRHLRQPDSKYKQLDGLSGEDYLNKAEALFKEMDLQWDLIELEKVRQQLK